MKTLKIRIQCALGVLAIVCGSPAIGDQDCAELVLGRFAGGPIQIAEGPYQSNSADNFCANGVPAHVTTYAWDYYSHSPHYFGFNWVVRLIENYWSTGTFHGTFIASGETAEQGYNGIYDIPFREDGIVCADGRAKYTKYTLPVGPSVVICNTIDP